jgi:hypothetical protein
MTHIPVPVHRFVENILVEYRHACRVEGAVAVTSTYLH